MTARFHNERSDGILCVVGVEIRADVAIGIVRGDSINMSPVSSVVLNSHTDDSALAGSDTIKIVRTSETTKS